MLLLWSWSHCYGDVGHVDMVMLVTLLWWCCWSHCYGDVGHVVMVMLLVTLVLLAAFCRSCQHDVQDEPQCIGKVCITTLLHISHTITHNHNSHITHYHTHHHASHTHTPHFTYIKHTIRLHIHPSHTLFTYTILIYLLHIHPPPSLFFPPPSHTHAYSCLASSVVVDEKRLTERVQKKCKSMAVIMSHTCSTQTHQKLLSELWWLEVCMCVCVQWCSKAGRLMVFCLRSSTRDCVTIR